MKKLFRIPFATVLLITISFWVLTGCNSDFDIRIEESSDTQENQETLTVRKFKGVYSENEEYFDSYDIVEQDKYRIYTITEYDNETNEKIHEIKYLYDNERNIEERHYYDENGLLYYKRIYKLYDDRKYKSCKEYSVEDGKESLELEYSFAGLDQVDKVEIPDNYVFIEYDEYNRITVWEERYLDGSWYKTYTEYDENGIVSERSIDYDGNTSLWVLTPMS